MHTLPCSSCIHHPLSHFSRALDMAWVGVGVTVGPFIHVKNNCVRGWELSTSHSRKRPRFDFDLLYYSQGLVCRLFCRTSQLIIDQPNILFQFGVCISAPCPGRASSHGGLYAKQVRVVVQIMSSGPRFE